MKNKHININKDLIKRKNYLKNEIKIIVLKSIVRNQSVKPTLRSLAKKKMSQIKLKSFISKQNNNICLYTGRIKGVLRLTEMSRHHMKKFSTTGTLQNIKIKSW